MMLHIKSYPLWLRLYPSVFGALAILSCDIGTIYKIVIIAGLSILGVWDVVKRNMHYKVNYLPLSKTWLLHQPQVTKIAKLEGNSFNSQWIIILNWRMLDHKKYTAVLLRWHYDEVTWRHYRMLVPLQDVV